LSDVVVVWLCWQVEALQAVLEEQGVDVDDILAKVEEEYGFGDGDDDGEEREED
jgi:hypothetical protein